MVFDLILEKREYVPNYKNNRTAPREEKVVVTIKNITLAERQKIVRVSASEGEARIQYDYDEALQFVEKIENLTVGKDKITTGAQLAKMSGKARGINSLIRDIVVEGVVGDDEVEF